MDSRNTSHAAPCRTSQVEEPRVPSTWMALAYTALHAESEPRRIGAALVLASLVAEHTGVPT